MEDNQNPVDNNTTPATQPTPPEPPKMPAPPPGDDDMQDRLERLEVTTPVITPEEFHKPSNT